MYQFLPPHSCYSLQIFEGNDNSSDVVYHEFNVSRNARFVRFYPLTYENNACIQVELYGQRILKGKFNIHFQEF